MFKGKIKSILIQFYPLTFPISVSDEKSFQLLLNFVRDKRNSSLGDSLVNFIFSCAKTITNKTVGSEKVSDKILIEAYQKSNLALNLKLTGEKKKLGNYLESVILLMWVFELLTIDDLVSRITENLSENKDRFSEDVRAVHAFKRLFDICSNLIFD